MIAIIVSELKQWSDKYSRQTLGTLILSVTLFSCLAGLRPELFLTGVTIALIWLGIRAGDQAWSEVELDNWLIKAGLTPLQAISGKMFVTCIIVLCHYFILWPIISLMTVLWGVEWWIVVGINVLILIITLLVTSFSLVFKPSEGSNMIINCLFLFCLLLITFITPYLRFVNPFYQIWMLSEPGFTTRIGVCILVNLGLLLLMNGILFLFMTKEVKRK
jgi:hypothetical protein